jgi:hypothetical protein
VIQANLALVARRMIKRRAKRVMQVPVVTSLMMMKMMEKTRMWIWMEIPEATRLRKAPKVMKSLRLRL